MHSSTVCRGLTETTGAVMNLVDLGFFGEMAHQDAFAGVVALGEYANQAIVREDQ